MWPFFRCTPKNGHRVFHWLHTPITACDAGDLSSPVVGAKVGGERRSATRIDRRPPLFVHDDGAHSRGIPVDSDQPVIELLDGDLTAVTLGGFGERQLQRRLRGADQCARPDNDRVLLE